STAQEQEPCRRSRRRAWIERVASEEKRRKLSQNSRQNLHPISSNRSALQGVEARAMRRSLRERGRTLVIIVATIATGLASRRPGSPEFVQQYAGDVLWGALFFYLFKLLCPHLARFRLWLCAVATTELIELSQLWQAPWLVRMRATSIGGLLLGHQFLVS